MRVKSKAYETDLLLIAESGRVDEHDSYTVARMPENPSFYWGNFLLMPEAPKTGDCRRWMTWFQKEFGGDSNVRHMSFGWDDPQGNEGALDEFKAEGFKLDRNDVLTAGPFDLIRPATPEQELELRPLESDEDWMMAVELQILCRGAGYDPAVYRDFKIRRLRAFRRMVEQDRGRWYGAFHDNRLVGDLGLFSFEGTARFQLVETHPDHRRRGVCRNLVYFAANDFLLTGDAEELILVAEEHSVESKIYQSLGFQVTEKQVGVVKA